MKVDVYSFGMTMLEMARGKAPYAGMPFDCVAMNKLHHPSPSLPATYDGRTYSSVTPPPLPPVLHRAHYPPSTAAEQISAAPSRRSWSSDFRGCHSLPDTHLAQRVLMRPKDCTASL